jgi:hypothetical protein
VVVAGVEALLFKGLLSKGFPTAISQRWPGWPCRGFNPLIGTADGVMAAGFEAVCTSGPINGAREVPVGFVEAGVPDVTGLAIVDGDVIGLLLNGAPTAISQRCPGLP